MAPILVEHATLIGVAFLLAGGLLHLLSWGELEEWNWFDIVMREGPPYEDLSPRGQLLLIASWLSAAAGAGLLLAVYALPRVLELARTGS